MNCRWKTFTCFTLVTTYKTAHIMIAHAMTGFPLTHCLTTHLHREIGTSGADLSRSTGVVSSISLHISSIGPWYLLACFILQARSSFLLSVLYMTACMKELTIEGLTLAVTHIFVKFLSHRRKKNPSGKVYSAIC